MANLVCFHAHPDDEAIATGGLMALSAAAGHRVVLVCATRGEQGEPVDGVLAEGEALWERRVAELAESCQVLGAEAPRFLGYEDSGMIGTPANDNPACFWQADHEEAVARLVAILEEVDASVLTIYDEGGGYGHPDHLRVHSVGMEAAERAGVEHVYESTINRDAVREFMAAQAESEGPRPGDDDDDFDPESFGTPAEHIAYELDVSSVVDRKKKSMLAHASQIGPDSFFLQIPDETFASMFAVEWFNEVGVKDTGGPARVEVLPGL